MQKQYTGGALEQNAGLMGFNGIQWDLQLTPITSYNYMVCDIYSYSVYVGYNPTYDWWCPTLY